jgi:hypothetical protein
VPGGCPPGTNSDNGGDGSEDGDEDDDDGDDDGDDDVDNGGDDFDWENEEDGNCVIHGLPDWNLDGIGDVSGLSNPWCTMVKYAKAYH